jgi:hypothetical protein
MVAAAALFHMSVSMAVTTISVSIRAPIIGRTMRRIELEARRRSIRAPIIDRTMRRIELGAQRWSIRAPIIIIIIIIDRTMRRIELEARRRIVGYDDGIAMS